MFTSRAGAGVCCSYYMRRVPHHRPFSTTTTAKPKNDHNHRHKYILAATASTALISLSIYTRHVSDEKLSHLALAKDCGLLSSDVDNEDSSSSNQYNLPYIIEQVTRAGLVGTTKSVKDELQYIRKWHIERGYNGGIVLRDVTRPLFSLPESLGLDTNANNSEEENNNSNTSMEDTINPKHANRRECYYLYYEIHSNGQTKQQIFCRGTTLIYDVLTCLQTLFVYDDELECNVHYGFNQHANRIVEDVIPLLAPPRSDNLSGVATIEVCGHSLGGALACLVAAKLMKRGYIVTMVTSLAGPRLCKGKTDRETLQKLLPAQTIRIEDDLDVVSYLPPTGLAVGDKLWFANDNNAYMIRQDLGDENDWIDSVWLNLKIFETILNQSQKHRVKSYIKSLQQLVIDMNKSD